MHGNADEQPMYHLVKLFDMKQSNRMFALRFPRQLELKQHHKHLRKNCAEDQFKLDDTKVDGALGVAVEDGARQFRYVCKLLVPAVCHSNLC